VTWKRLGVDLIPVTTDDFLTAANQAHEAR